MVHCYQLGEFNIVLDVASGSVHVVDKVAYDVIRLYESELIKYDLSSFVRRIIDIHPNTTNGDVLEIISDINILINQNKLFSKDFYESLLKKSENYTLKALCLNVSDVCNMSCTYCFAGCAERLQSDGKNLNNKQNFNKNSTIQKDGLMSLDTGKKAIDFLIENSGFNKVLDIDFFGGEPLLNWDVIKQIVYYALEKEKKYDKSFRFTLTTNGLYIDDDVINFSNEYMHNVVLSLDGRPDVHNSKRKLHDRSDSFEIIAPKIKKFVDSRLGKGYYIRGTYTRDNLDFVNDILFLASIGYKELSMEPVVTKPGESYGFSADDLPALFEQYEILAYEMLRRKEQCNEFSFYHYTIDLYNGPCVHKRIAGCGVGTEYLAVTPKGTLYPCHQFVGDESFIMGNVSTGVTNRLLRDEFAGTNIYSRAECRTCWARFYCSGGCAANAYFDCGNINGVHSLGCDLFKKRLECAIMLKVANYKKER